MSDKLKVGDVCHEPERLRAGARVLAFDTPYLLTARRHHLDGAAEGWTVQQVGSATWLHDDSIRIHGVTVLSLPRAANPEPVSEPYGLPAEPAQCREDEWKPNPITPAGGLLPAASTLDVAVPVGSRWRWRNDQPASPFTYLGGDRIQYDDDPDGRSDPGERGYILREATRIDEPAKGEALGDDVPKPIEALKNVDASEAIRRFNELTKPRAPEPPAPPPARCAPEPFVTHPACLLAHFGELCLRCEELIAAAMEEPNMLTGSKRYDDAEEAARWRSQRYQAPQSGRGGMIGRFSYDRRPR